MNARTGMMKTRILDDLSGSVCAGMGRWLCHSQGGMGRSYIGMTHARIGEKQLEIALLSISPYLIFNCFWSLTDLSKLILFWSEQSV